MSSQDKFIDYERVNVLVEEVDASNGQVSIVRREELLPPARVRSYHRKEFNVLHAPSIWRTGLGKIEIFVPSELFAVEWEPQKSGIHPFRVEENAWIFSSQSESLESLDGESRRPLLISRSLYSEAKPAGMLYECSVTKNNLAPNESIHLRSRDFYYEISFHLIPWKHSETVNEFQ